MYHTENRIMGACNPIGLASCLTRLDDWFYLQMVCIFTINGGRCMRRNGIIMLNPNDRYSANENHSASC